MAGFSELCWGSAGLADVERKGRILACPMRRLPTAGWGSSSYTVQIVRAMEKK